MRNANLLLYLNLAGEVFYIIVHRMKSQKVKEEHQERVRNDIAVAICHSTVIQNLLKGSLQILNLKLADVRILLDRIVHSSIMTVNAFSMEKLFELTLIATKYQYTTCQFPSDILLIALNHLDTIRKTVTDTTAKTLAENLHNLLVDRFKDVDIRMMQTYRYLVLSYLADVKLKMTNLIRLGLQKSSGEFVKHFPDKVKRPELHQPGLIEVYKSPTEDEDGKEVECTSGCESHCDCDMFDCEDTLTSLNAGKCPTQVHESASKGSGDTIITSRFKPEDPPGWEAYPMLKTSLGMHGSRGVPLGLSIYDVPGNCDDGPVKRDDTGGPADSQTEAEPKSNQRNYEATGEFEDDYLSSVDLFATKGLDLCSVMLGCNPTSTTSSTEGGEGEEPQTSQKPVSASALGLQSVLDSFPSFGIGKQEFGPPGVHPQFGEQLQMNPNSVNVIQFDARSNSTGSKALVAIAQDFFELDAQNMEGVRGGSAAKYKTTMDDLLDNFDIRDEDEDNAS